MTDDIGEVDISGPQRSALERAIAGALRLCIDVHGPITREWTGSAAKRVIGVIKGHNQERRRSKEKLREGSPP